MFARIPFIAKIHEYIRGARTTRRGATAHPSQVARGTHKEYLRMPRLPLPAPAPLAGTLGEALATRASMGECVSGRACTSAEIGSLLGHALGMRTELLRRYPSGGALYPVETYLIGSALESEDPGVFHYHPRAHALEHLWPASPDMAEILRTPSIPLPPLLAVFTSVWERSSAKYGDLAYAHAHLEAGHMAQNLLLVATALGFAARPVAGFHDQTVTEVLGLDPRAEQPLYAVLLCPPGEPGAPAAPSGTVFE